MRVAIIGCGNIAQVHAWSLCKIKDIQIVAFVDCRIEKALEMSAKYTDGQAAVFEDYQVMLQKIKPEVVHICTPHYLHVPMAIDALKSNVAVFMEKPPAITGEEFTALSEAAEHTDKTVGFCFQNRYNPTTLELDRLVAGEEMGEVIGARSLVTWRRDESYYSDDWHGSLEKEGGGVLLNQSVHTLDLMLRYMGEPVNVSASMQNHHLQGVCEVEDTMEAWLEFKDGRRASFYATNAYVCDAPVILELTFERGRATMIDRTIQIEPSGGEPRTIICKLPMDGIGKSYWGRGHLDCITDFYESMKNGTRYANDINGVANTLFTTVRIYEDARKRGKREE